MDSYILKLFISGTSMRSRKAREYAEKLAEKRVDITLKVIDVLENPDPAEDYKVMATPTLIRTSPLPERRIIGDLKNADKVIEFLDI